MTERTTGEQTTAHGIVADVERRVAEGTLPPGSRLPTVRAMAADLAVAPGTVASAYRQLAERGTLVARGRRGTFVAARPAVSSAPRTPVPPGVVDLRSGGPDPDLLPELPVLASDRVGYDADAVHPALREVASEGFRAAGVPADHLAVVGGAMDGVERLLQTHLRPGDAIAVEDPGYPYVVDIARAMGFAPIAVATDDDGMVPDALRDVLGRVKAVVVTPRAANPTGAAFTSTRARVLGAALAAHPGVLAIEDDHAGAVAGVPLESAVHRASHWAVVQSVAKSLGPDLRLAVVSGDPDTVERLGARQRLGTGWVSHLLQRTVAAALCDPKVQAALARARDAYAERRHALLDELAALDVAASGRSGHNVWARVDDEHAATIAALSAGFAIEPGARFRHQSPPAVRISVGQLRPADAPAVAAAVARGVGRANRFTT